MIGDYDDVIMFIVWSVGCFFCGCYWLVGGLFMVIELDLVEIIWWIVLEDVNGNGMLDIGE